MFNVLSVSYQPPPQALHFFTQRRLRNASDMPVTGDEAQGTMGRTKMRGEVTSRPFSLSRLPLRSNFHGERDVWVRGRILTVPNSACKCKSATCCNFRGSCLLSIKLKLKNPGSSTKSALNRPRSVKSVKLNQ